MLTDAQTDKAVTYNKKQGYCEHEIKLVQKTVGATEDGKWGPQTVNRVAVWQKAEDLTADGMVGPATYEAIKASWELCPTEPPEGPSVEVGCGLAAYDQEWPGRKPEEALQRAWDQALAEGCKEIRFWSSEWLIDESLPNGGNKGNKYSGPWLASQVIPEDVVVGAWIDDPRRTAMSEGFADRLVEMHITRAAIMINKSNTRPNNVPWALRWKRDDLEKLAALYHSKGIECIATCWPQPSKSQIDAMCEDMAWILPVLGSKIFEVDTEGNWKPKFLDGFRSMQAASEYLASQMRELVGAAGELELTTYTYHSENSKTAKLAPLMDRLLPQAYSVRHRANETVAWNSSLGPGKHQTLAVNRARQAAAGK
jgi:hypothetical protein